MPTVSLSEIPTLALLYKLNKLSAYSAEDTVPEATSKYNDKISLIRTDITKLETDAIVNAANESLLGGGGVDGAIHSAAGPDLVKECRYLHGCDTGDAKITGAYRLPCKKVIHAVGPVYYSTKREGMHTTLLSSCYTKSLDLAVENDCKSIAFSALSTGVYGYPSDEAAETAITAVKGWLDDDAKRAEKMDRIVFCSFLAKDENAYNEYVPAFFPPASSEEQEVTSKEDEATAARSTEVKVGEEAEATVPELPGVPTKEPTEEGEPEAKKVKLDEASEGEGEGEWVKV